MVSVPLTVERLMRPTRTKAGRLRWGRGRRHVAFIMCNWHKIGLWWPPIVVAQMSIQKTLTYGRPHLRHVVCQLVV